MFRAASDDDIEANSDTVTCFIRKCIEDVVPTKTIRIYPNQKPWINDRKQGSYDLRKSIKVAKRQYKNKVEEQFNTNNARNMWQGINNITGFKGNKLATVNNATSLPDELNHFYARFEAHNTTHTESAPAAAAEEVSALSISVADVTRSFWRLNIRKAVGPDGIPGRVLQACAFQIGVYRHLQTFPLSVRFLMLQKIHHCTYTKEKYNHMFEWLEARCSDTHLQQVFWETHQRLHLLCAACLIGSYFGFVPYRKLILRLLHVNTTFTGFTWWKWNLMMHSA